MVSTVENILVVQVSGGPESFLIGGTIARLIAEGNEVTVLTCARPVNAAVREAETAEIFRALMELKVTNHRFLGSTLYRKPGRIMDRRYYLPDDANNRLGTGAIPQPTESEANPGTDNIPVGVLAISTENMDELDADLNVIMSEVQPDVVLLALPEKLDVPSEILSELIVQSGTERQIPVYQFSWEADTRDDHYRVVDIERYLQEKTAAIGQHRSRGRVIGESVVLANNENVLINRIERFHLLHEPFSAWSRLALIICTFLTFLGGGLLTFTATFMHNQTMEAFGNPAAPTGALLGLLLVACYVLGIRLACSHRFPLYAASGAVIATIFALGMFEVNNQILIGDTLGGWIWLIGAPMLAIIIGLWPKLALPPRSEEGLGGTRTRFKRKVR